MLFINYRKEFIRRNARHFNAIAWNKRLIKEWKPKILRAQQQIKDASRAIVQDIMNDSDIENSDIIGDELFSCLPPDQN